MNPDHMPRNSQRDQDPDFLQVFEITLEPRNKYNVVAKNIDSALNYAHAHFDGKIVKIEEIMQIDGFAHACSCGGNCQMLNIND